ncbi:MOSC domain-containing protein [Pararhizobium qamdonense]|uniref:MOSC domain-containing protein n=1 Tax=Pararhizobium qamdonense TaxID=3031126 RepID=UPI0023E128E2|nr:MOSC domain-containing protein [Pararhizobium qamdonense]
MTSVAIEALLTGFVKPLGTRAAASGIDKTQVTVPTKLTETGFEGDAQGDLVRHGGREKAVHHYPLDHYLAWRGEIGVHRLLGMPVAFGENVSTIGLTENTVSIGDVFRAGTAVIEVSQGRQPCWKLNEPFGDPSIAKRVQSTGRTGWYYRVLQSGIVAPDDSIDRIERRSPDWTIARIWRAFYVDVLNRDELAQLSELSRLAESWRTHAVKRLQTNTVEDWTQRLTGRSP